MTKQLVELTGCVHRHSVECFPTAKKDVELSDLVARQSDQPLSQDGLLLDSLVNDSWWSMIRPNSDREGTRQTRVDRTLVPNHAKSS